jgi:hypothetical protein
MQTDSCPPAPRVKIYGKIIADQRYEPASWQGQSSRRFPSGIQNGLKKGWQAHALSQS